MAGYNRNFILAHKGSSTTPIIIIEDYDEMVGKKSGKALLREEGKSPPKARSMYRSLHIL
jgi:hypothetical protein